MITLIIFIFGLAIGSFLNVLIYRLPQSLAINGRSFCPKCKKKIAWFDNIPLLSFILLGGKCRHCHSPISWQYPLVELITGVLTVFSLWSLVSHGQNLLSIIYYLFIIYALIVIFFTDLKEQIIPDQVVYLAIFISIIYHLPSIIFLLSGLVAAGFLFLLYWLTHGRGMGLGDVKLAALMGLFLGFPKIILAFYLAFLTGAALGVILILVGKKKLTSQIPFGPFLVLAAIFSLFWGNTVWERLIGLP